MVAKDRYASAGAGTACHFSHEVVHVEGIDSFPVEILVWERAEVAEI